MSKKLAGPIDKWIGARIRDRRNGLGLSQGDLAQALRLSYQQIQKYEDGTNRISAARLFHLSRALSIGASYFYDGLGEHLRGLSGFAEAHQLAYSAPQTEAGESHTLDEAFKRITQQRRRKIVLDLAAALADEDRDE